VGAWERQSVKSVLMMTSEQLLQQIANRLDLLNRLVCFEIGVTFMILFFFLKGRG